MPETFTVQKYNEHSTPPKVEKSNLQLIMSIANALTLDMHGFPHLQTPSVRA